MEMSSTRTVPASVEATWDALNDPAFLKECIAGCESIERAAENEYKVVMAAKVGPVNARFNGRMTLTDLDPPRAYTLNFEGQGGAAGFAKGNARVELVPEQDNTVTAMSYRVTAQVGGKLAQIGSRLVDGAARKVADDFFTAFVAKLAERSGVAATAGLAGAPGEGVAAPGTGGPAAERPGTGLSRNKVIIWAVLIIVALVLWVLLR